jgi:2-polyprenyl-6-methoxyphenol hydroxylase-like FAD-dependent oxidoreductase
MARTSDRRDSDVVIVGGGLAGSTAAAMLGRAGITTVLIDPHKLYPPDFRCEKLDGPQAELLRRTGIGEAVLASAARDRQAWVAHMGRVIDKRPGDQHGIRYDALVNIMRAQIPGETRVVHSKVTHIETGIDAQRVQLADGETITCRLVVLANGLNNGLRQSLGLGRTVTSACHSVTIGFDVRARGRTAFPFSSLTYYAQHPRHRMAYLTLFPVSDGVRANFMVYRDIHDPWFDTFRADPRASLFASMPGLETITGDLEVYGHIKIRPADLYVTTGTERAGMVLVGDAFSTSCPAAGTGTGKVFTDVERLCSTYIPRWLSTPGMAAEKIAAFYADPQKRAYDTYALDKAHFLRRLSTDTGFAWHARRWLRFGIRFAAGGLRKLRQRQAGAANSGAETIDRSMGSLAG